MRYLIKEFYYAFLCRAGYRFGDKPPTGKRLSELDSEWAFRLKHRVKLVDALVKWVKE